jgi:hypothetical protein
MPVNLPTQRLAVSCVCVRCGAKWVARMLEPVEALHCNGCFWYLARLKCLTGRREPRAMNGSVR